MLFLYRENTFYVNLWLIESICLTKPVHSIQKMY